MFTYNPYERAPRNYSAAAKEFWANVYQTSMANYTAIDEYYEEDARLTATVATLTAFRGGRHPTPCRGLRALPRHGDVAQLGIFLGVDYADRKGEVWAEKFHKRDGVPLMWSQSLRALIAVPRMKRSNCDLPPQPRESRVLRRWTKGRKSGICSERVDLGRPSLSQCSPGIAVWYWSDKFGEPSVYVHHFDSPGVKVYRGAEAFMIQGGRLRIEEHGVAG